MCALAEALVEVVDPQHQGVASVELLMRLAKNREGYGELLTPSLQLWRGTI